MAFHKSGVRWFNHRTLIKVSEDRVLGPYMLLSPSSATLLSGMAEFSEWSLSNLKIWCPKLSSILQVRKLTRPGNRTIVEEASLPWPQLKKSLGISAFTPSSSPWGFRLCPALFLSQEWLGYFEACTQDYKCWPGYRNILNVFRTYCVAQEL